LFFFTGLALSEHCPEVEYLHRGKVRRVVVGHKPSGEAPAILRTSGVDGKGCLFFIGFSGVVFDHVRHAGLYILLNPLYNII
jgi:hypothetical protein